MNTTVLTLTIESTGRFADLELPGDVPLREVLQRILPGLEEWGPYPFIEKEFHYFISSGDQHWKPVDISCTLDELKVTDGAYLRIEKSQNFSTRTID
ncbi:EsaB/YukD family protein [Paenibacillus sp. M1]|uniref:EsaB/YukD family protein n=1 Tax=Paenibacillus haidiansis TaxID=1574488 RepID=A0ABU7W0X2_9BACL